MTSLVEVKILGYDLVLACDETSTVAEITASAVAEVQAFNLRDFPRKVLHTKDTSGRILSGSLCLVRNNLEPKLEVVVASYNSNDILGPQETLTLYRDWQYWTVCQVQETIKTLSLHDIPSYPEESTINLLYELCKAPVEKVQLKCAKGLQILLTKFPQRNLVIEAAEQICKLFTNTTYSNVAVAALECFKGLSPLQARVFNGAKYIRQMYDVQQTLSRFSEDKQTALFEAFQAIAGILGDRELLSVVGAVQEPTQSHDEVQRGRAVSFIDTETTGSTKAATAPEQADGANNKAAPGGADILPSPPQPSSEVKRLNLKRLESLLQSEDARVRQYALQKLLKLLTLSAKAHTLSNTDHASNAEGGGGGGGAAAEVAPEVTVPQAPWTSRDSDAGVADSWDVGPMRPTSAYKFSFSDGREVESLVKSLFRCLKSCIHSRPKVAARNSDARDGDGEGKGGSPDRAAAQLAMPADKNKALTATSTAGRLIQTALHSSLSDEVSVLLIVDCLWQLVHFPQDIARDAHFPLGLLGQCHHTKSRLTGAPLSNVQLVFVGAAREWYRLLLTLAHADEGSKLLRWADLAEKCAFFFILVVLHGMEDGWKAAEVSLEASAICAFLSATQPTFRSYLALSYLTSLSDACFPDDSYPQKSSGVRRSDPADSSVLQDVLMCRNFEVSAGLWRWGTGAERARRSALMALSCLSSFCAFGSFTSFMLNLDPITRLAAMLQVAVRDDGQEKREFGLLSSPQGNRNDASSMVRARRPGDSLEDEWDVPRDATRIPVVEEPGEVDPNEETTSPRDGPTLDRAFQLGLGLSPRSAVVASAGDNLSAIDRLLAKRGIAAAPAAVAPTAIYVYPDVPLIRLILKVMANLLSASRSTGAYSEDYRGEVSNWLREVEVGAQGPDQPKVRLLRIVRRDEVVRFYFNLISQS